MRMKNLSCLKKTINLFRTMLVSVILLVGSGSVWGQSYLGLDGGFEGTSTIDNTTIASVGISNSWTKNNASLTIGRVTNIVRSGSNSIKINNTSKTTGRRVFTPIFTTTSSSALTIQFYRRSAATTSQIVTPVISKDGTVANDLSSTTYIGVKSANTWELETYSPTTTIANGIATWGGFLTKMSTTTEDYYIDDVCIYAGGVDTSAPSTPTSSNAGVAVNSLNVSWTAPVTGVDGGGYLVLRGTVDPTSALNENGIYAVGNTIGTGTVVYQGTGTSFTDAGLTAGTNYYYRIYTYDKAYNYSTALAANGTPVASLYPTTQASAITFSNVGLNDMTAGWTNGNGAKRVVIMNTSESFTTPTDGIDPIANAAYSGSGEQVVYNGSENSISVTGLNPSTTYWFRVYEYNGTGAGTKFLTSTAASNPNSQITTSPTPTITISETTVPAMIAEAGSTDAETITVSATDLTSNLTLALTGADAGMFSLDKESLTPTSGTLTGEVVTITYAPTEVGSHTATLILSSDGTSIIRDISGTATAGTLTAPLATAAADVTASGFTANWGAVAGATGYEVSVYTKTEGTTERFKQEFTWIENGWGGNDGYWSGSIASATAGLAEHLVGWSVIKGYKGDNCIKMGIGDTQGVLQTPALGLNGNATLTFRAGAWDVYGEKTDLLLEITGGGTLDKTSVQMLLGSFTNYSILITGATPSTRITFKGEAKNNSRFFLDDVVITQKSVTATPIAGSPFTVTDVTTTSLNVPGLNPGTAYFYIVKAKKMYATSEASNEISATTLATTLTVSTAVNASTLADCASCDVVVGSGGHLTVNANKTYNKVTVNAGGKLTLANGSTLTAPLTIESNGTNGTGTYVDENTGTGLPAITGTVNQFLPAAAEREWWYLASPVSGAVSDVFGSNKVGDYSETTRSYSNPFISPTALLAGKGYAVKLTAMQAANVYKFENKTLNNGIISLPLTRTINGKLDNKRGFNLVGNPYPSYLNWELAHKASTNIRPTIWYRTKVGEIMDFQTYNAALGVSVPTSASGFIPPMQAFWVKVDTDPVSTETVSNGTLNLTNAMRAHAGTVENPLTNLLKTPAVSERPLMRLLLSDGTITDETVIVSNPGASDAYDLFDSEKMSISNTSLEIYSIVGTEKLVINGMNSLTVGKTIPLGFRPGQIGTFTIETTQLENLDANVLLIDKVNGTEQELKAGSTYSFDVTDAAATTDRFVISLVSNVPTGIENGSTNRDLRVYSNQNNRIQVFYDGELNDQTVVSVYSAAGQKLNTQKLVKAATELSGTFCPGVYLIQLNDGSRSITKKLIIN